MSLEHQSSKNNLFLTPTLENFDSLPDAAHVRQPVVEALYACSSATLWRYVKAGTIPEPKRFGGRITAWNVGQLRNSLTGAE
ncbi:MAG: AlpA family phage regulatory protein [Alphaproteobacteria bacterium]|nr:AlpA family phage regulatory protein [Alphaproteobacteria bacterium]